MAKTLTTFLLTAFFFGIFISAHGQSGEWREVSSTVALDRGEAVITARSAKYFELGFTSMFERLIDSPESTTIDLPNPDGKLVSFAIHANTVMQPGLQNKFPDIRSFDGLSVDGTHVRAKIDVSPSGLRAALYYPDQTVFIDPVLQGETDLYIVYLRSEFTSDKVFECSFNEQPSTQGGPKSGSDYRSCDLKTYRLAVAATAEYTQFHGGTVSQAMSAIVTTVNRVNQIYERDFGVTLSLIENNDQIVYTNSFTDPYTNGNPVAMINENQSNINSVIGSANYDIGHVFGTNSGGLAGLGVTCSNGSKARGVTGSAAPIGDPFDIDYVAHEMGHQFGATHTFNNSCNGNRTNSTAVEPGSGATIMAYAGICPPNIQMNSDDYFHAASLYQIGVQISGDNCPVTTEIDNSAPVIDSVMSNVYLPVSTPFALTGYAYDPDIDDVPTYVWEQMDVEISAQPPVANSTSGPNFRSLSPQPTPTRYFPALTELNTFGDPTWEVLPSVTRNMNFRFTVRDNAPGAGCTQYEDAVVHFVGEAGPFVVTHPNLPNIEWEPFTLETVTWDVAGTDLEPINASEVDIFLSADGGETYPILLVENVPNTGAAQIEVPNIITEEARIMVMSSAGTFFDISNNDLTINGITNGFAVMSDNADSSLCIGDDLVFDVHIEAIGGFNLPVTLSLVDPPVEFDAVLGATELMPGESTTLTISNTAGLSPGAADITVLGVAEDIEHTRLFQVGFNENDPDTPLDLVPSDGEEFMPTELVLNWTPSSSPDAVYHLQLSLDQEFATLVVDSVGFETNTFEVSGLLPETTYYWRVAQSNPCGTSAFSNVFSFSTHSCFAFPADDLPKPIPPSIGTSISTIELPYSGIISDVNVLGIQGTHARVSDLTFFLVSPSGTQVQLVSHICGSSQDFNFSFDDGASTGIPDCPPTSGQVLQPVEPLSALIGEDALGLWQLKIVDAEVGGGGQFEAWSLEVCIAGPGTFELSPASEALVVCQGEQVEVMVAVNEVFDFNDPVNLSTTGLPTGVSATYAPQTVSPGDTAVLTLQVDAAVDAASYEFSLTGTSGETVVDRPMTLAVNESSPNAVTLLSPTDGDTEVAALHTFQWTSATSPIAVYGLDIAFDEEFTDLFDVVEDIDTTVYTYAGLPPATTLYWRVRTDNNCGVVFSEPNLFVTRPCTLQAPQDLPIAISAAPSTYTSTVDVSLSGQVSSIRVSGLRGTHFRVSDLSVRLISPMGTEVLLFDSICPGDQDFFLNFEDGASPVIDCPPTEGNTYAPEEPLSAFIDEDPFGTWTLEVEDFKVGGGGELLEWNLELCYTEDVFATDDTEVFALSIFPNPTHGQFRIVVGAESEVDRIEIRDTAGRLLEIHTLNGLREVDVDLGNYATGLYFVRAIGKAGASSYKLIKSR